MKLFKDGGAGGNGSPWRFMERFEVPSIEQPTENHFVRYRLVQTPWFGVYVHRFDNPDVRTFHDHPWNFVSVVVRGGYVEASPHGGAPAVSLAQVPDHRLLRAGSINRKRATDLHYIADLVRKPTWTLILVGKRQRTWGYVDEAGWTAFDEHPNAAKFDAAMAARR